LPQTEIQHGRNLTKYATSIDPYVKKEDKIGRINDEKGGEQSEQARTIIENEKRDLLHIFNKDKHDLSFLILKGRHIALLFEREATEHSL